MMSNRRASLVAAPEPGHQSALTPARVRVKPKHRLLKRFSWLVTIVAAVFAAYGLADPRAVFHQFGPVSDPTGYDSGYTIHYAQAALVLFVGYWVLVVVLKLAWAYHRAVQRTVDVMIKPIPSLPEIAAQLRAEGFDPGIQDVIAVEQHLKSQRNEAAVMLGALVIGPQLLARQAQGKPLL